VGKSTLLNQLTGTESLAAGEKRAKPGAAGFVLLIIYLQCTTRCLSLPAAYEFTTLTAIPGTMQYRGAKIQMIDLPGIIEGAKDGKGRGRQVISTARTCNMLLIVLDCMKVSGLLWSGLQYLPCRNIVVAYTPAHPEHYAQEKD
jgi:ribosome-interacting GTPase 1